MDQDQWIHFRVYIRVDAFNLSYLVSYILNLIRIFSMYVYGSQQDVFTVSLLSFDWNISMHMIVRVG